MEPQRNDSMSEVKLKCSSGLEQSKVDNLEQKMKSEEVNDLLESQTKMETASSGSGILCFPTHDLKDIFSVAAGMLESVRSMMSSGGSDASVILCNQSTGCDFKLGPLHANSHLLPYVTNVTDYGVVIDFPTSTWSLEQEREEMDVTYKQECASIVSETDVTDIGISFLFEEPQELTEELKACEDEADVYDNLPEVEAQVKQEEEEIKDGKVEANVKMEDDKLQEENEEKVKEGDTLEDQEAEQVLETDKLQESEVGEFERKVEEPKQEMIAIPELKEEETVPETVQEMDDVHQQTEDEDATKVQITSVPVFFIKRSSDLVDPLESHVLFRWDEVQNLELRSGNEIFTQQLEDVLEHVPAGQRQSHFRKMDRYQYIPHAMNEEFKTNLLDMDSMRIYETLAVARDILWPVSSTVDDDEYNVLFMCPPTGGVVSGTKMFLDLTQPQLNTDWIALTRHPWEEWIDLDKIVVDDSILHWEMSKWRFVLDQDLAITSTEQIDKLILEVKVGLDKKPDLIIADLSPSHINMESEGYELNVGLAKVLVTEAAQIELSLRVLKDGGNLIVSLTNPVDLTCTVGNLGFLSGLFSTVAVVFSRSSSTWLRPAMVVCSGYIGIDAFQAKYPHFSQEYLSSVTYYCISSHFVMLDTIDLPQSVVKGLERMASAWATQELQRLYSLCTLYANRNNNGNDDQRLEEQIQASQDWMQELLDHVVHISREWNISSRVVQVCDVEALEGLKQLWGTECHLTDEAMDFSLNRLQETYIDGEIPFPNEMNVPLKEVQTLKDEKVVRKVFPTTMSFSRFTSTKQVYDFWIARKVGSFFPVEGLAWGIVSGVPQTCGNHIKANLQKALAGEGFGIHVDDEHLVTVCLNLPTFVKVSFNEADIHKRILEILLVPFKGPKVMDNGDTLFACMMPVTTRLLLGFVCVISRCFTRTSLVISKPDRMMGVLFEGFHGHRENTTLMAKNRLESMISELADKKNVDMEIIPRASLFECVDLASLIEYNNTIIKKATVTIVNVVIASLEDYCDVGPLF